MATGKSERILGNDWAEVMRDRGAWVQKLPASSLAGLPDWLMVHPDVGICLVEAKKLRNSGAAFLPSQCSRAQRFFLEVVARYGGKSRVLVLGPDSWFMWRVTGWGGVAPLDRAVFEQHAEAY